MYKCVEDDGKFFCMSDKEDEPNIPCASENDAQSLVIFLNTQIGTVENMIGYIEKLEMDLLSISRNIAHIVSKQYAFRDHQRFSYFYNEQDEIYELVDKYGEFGPWASLAEADLQYLTQFMNRLQFEKEDLEVELGHAKEELNNFKGLPQAHLMHDLTQDIFEINNIIGFFVENDLEPERVKYESKSVKEILERLLKVMEGYE